MAQEDNSLTVVQQGYKSNAIVLVNGINSSFTFFEDWLKAPAFENYTVYAFNVNHRRFTMTESAEALAQHILALKNNNIRVVNIFAHSMGGLVSKKALDLLASNNQLAEFGLVNLSTMGTPWGGFSKASLATWVPGSKFVCKVLGYPMCTEIAPNADFMKKLSVPLPVNVRFEILDSSSDSVAKPQSEDEKNRYAEIAFNASTHKTISGLGHDDFGIVAQVVASLN